MNIIRRPISNGISERIYDVVNLAVDAARTDVILNRNMDKRRARRKKRNKLRLAVASSCRRRVVTATGTNSLDDLIIVTDKRAIGRR